MAVHPPPDLDKDVSFQEWQACRESLSQFDNTIVDLRKFGFGLITVLLSANGFLFTASGIGVVAILGIYIALLVLIVGLFRLDRVHEVFIRATVIRAMQLEDIARPAAAPGGAIKMGLTWQLAYWSEKLSTATWGHYLYMFFCFAAYALAAAGILSIKDPDCTTVPAVLLLALATGMIAITVVSRSHRASATMGAVFFAAINRRRSEFGYDELNETPGDKAVRDWFVMLVLFLVLLAGALYVSQHHSACSIVPDLLRDGLGLPFG